MTVCVRRKNGRDLPNVNSEYLLEQRILTSFVRGNIIVPTSDLLFCWI